MRNTVGNVEPRVLLSKDSSCLSVTRSPRSFAVSINIVLQSKCFALVLKVFCSKYLASPYSVLHSWAVGTEIIDKYEMQEIISKLIL